MCLLFNIFLDLTVLFMVNWFEWWDKYLILFGKILRRSSESRLLNRHIYTVWSWFSALKLILSRPWSMLFKRIAKSANTRSKKIIFLFVKWSFTTNSISLIFNQYILYDLFALFLTLWRYSLKFSNWLTIFFTIKLHLFLIRLTNLIWARS